MMPMQWQSEYYSFQNLATLAYGFMKWYAQWRLSIFLTF